MPLPELTPEHMAIIDEATHRFGRESAYSYIARAFVGEFRGYNQGIRVLAPGELPVVYERCTVNGETTERRFVVPISHYCLKDTIDITTTSPAKFAQKLMQKWDELLARMGNTDRSMVVRSNPEALITTVPDQPNKREFAVYCDVGFYASAEGATFPYHEFAEPAYSNYTGYSLAAQGSERTIEWLERWH